MLIGYLLWALTLTILGAKLKREYGWETITQYFAWSLASDGLIVILLFTLQSIVTQFRYSTLAHSGQLIICHGKC